MAGVLPGVVARRRRVHHTSSTNNVTSSGNTCFLSSRRSAFSVFSNNNSSASFLGQTRSRTYQDNQTWKLGALAREAKERLDSKLRSQTITIRNSNNEEGMNDNITVREQLRREVFGRRKKNGNREAKRWLIAKLGWKWKRGGGEHDHEMEECAVCLNEVKVGDDILNLECSHTFHSTCLMPWLHTNAHCPCCRLSIF